MLEVLQLVFANFWTFIGTLMLISACGWAVARIILAVRGIDVVRDDD